MILISKVMRVRCAVLVLGAACALSARAEARLLPEVMLVDQAGLATSTRTLPPGGRWALIVVEAGQPSAQALLASLARRQGGWTGKLVIVVAGAAPQAQRLVQQHAALDGVTWLFDRERNLPAALALRATPAVHAITDNGEIGWHVLGMPAHANLPAMLSQWLGTQPMARVR
ncbi:hypothetical protein [Massilia sp. CF038]|uniref:hypothetical protein n=1 Tax=Massilia sp. CF038 TaxID=1881045 RepID=UPI00091E987B|nr:hypothetical protein [Massilia sp. CF038]SHG67399.1 hypothetical protein SAMN05428948_1552 [Massilia sp. CF038]